MGCLDAESPTPYIDRLRATIDVTMVTAIIVGNMWIVISVCRYWCRRSIPRNNQGSTLLVVNLSAADTVVGLSRIYYFVPRYLCEMRVLYATYNPCMLKYVVTIMSHVASGYTLIAIAVDRYIAVTRPFKYADIMTVRRTAVVVVLVWICAVAQSSTVYFRNNWRPGGGCAEDVVPVTYTLVGGLGAQSLVMGVAVAVYRRIHKEAQRIRKMCQKNNNHDHPAVSVTTKSARAMVLIVGVYTLCWVPFMTAIILREAGLSVPPTFLEIASSFLNVNYVVNPLIYACNTRHVRTAMVSTWWNNCCWWQKGGSIVGREENGAVTPLKGMEVNGHGIRRLKETCV